MAVRIVDAPSGNRVEHRRQDGDERLPLTGRHLSQLALVERHGGHHLHVEGPEAEDACARLAGERVELGERLVERGAAPGAFAKASDRAVTSASDRRDVGTSSMRLSVRR